jgi:hypothetical protein
MALAASDPLLPEQHGAGGVQLDGNAQKQQQPAKTNDAQQGQHNGKEPFEAVLVHGGDLTNSIYFYDTLYRFMNGL